MKTENHLQELTALIFVEDGEKTQEVYRQENKIKVVLFKVFPVSKILKSLLQMKILYFFLNGLN